jgi:tetratricopeptide (TPR) repeat protein
MLSRLDEAEAQLQSVLAASPAHVAATLGLGRIARQRGDRAAALAQFRTALALEPSHAGARVEVAAELAALSRTDEADAMLREALDSEPEHLGALMGLARLARLSGDHQATLARVEVILALDPGHLWAQLELARLLVDLGRTEDARRRIRETLRHHPKHAPALALGGMLARRAGRRKLALRAYRACAANDPRSAQPWVEIAIEERALGRPQLSLAALHRALDLEPDHLAALVELVAHERLATRYETALLTAQRAVTAHPMQLRARLTLCRTLVDLAASEEAKQALDDTEAALGPDPEIDVLRIRIALDSGEFDQARAIMAAAMARHPSHFGLWAENVHLAFRLGDLEAAERALCAPPPRRSALEQARSHHLRGQIARDRWQLDTAAEAFRATLEFDPHNSAAHEELARLALMAADLDAVQQRLTVIHQVSTASRLLQQRSLNLSQSFLGQLLDEFRLDQSLADRLRRTMALSPEDRIETLCGLIREHIGATAPAVCLLVALRCVGWLRVSEPVRTAGISLIPHRIMQYWDATEPPPEIGALMQSWPERNPDWSYQLFDDAAAQRYLAARLLPPVLRAYRSAPNSAQRSDLFRLAWLFVEGGVYADADDRCVAPVATIVPADATLVLYQEEYGTLGNNFVAARPREPAIGRALAASVASLNRGDRDLLWLASGPGAVTRAFAMELAIAPGSPTTWLRSRVVLTRSELARAVAYHCRARYKLDRHWLHAAIPALRTAPTVMLAAVTPPQQDII